MEHDEYQNLERRRTDELKHEIDEIRLIVSDIKEHKQDKIKPALIITVVIWMLSVTGGGAYWAAVISTNLSNLQHVITTRMNDRYTSADAKADLVVRDQRMDYIEERVEDLEHDIKEITKKGSR